jgi:hypothetical protein
MFFPHLTVDEGDLSFQDREDIVDIDDEIIESPLFLVKPGLRKLGDGWGATLDDELILVPAAVACARDGD